MSILRTYNLQNPDSATTNIELTADGGAVISGVTTVTGNLEVSEGITATSITGVSTAGITTAYIGSVNDGPISGTRNRIINGDMRIDQRNAGAAVTGSTAYPVDRWITFNATDGSYSGQRSTDVPTGQGFTNSLKYTITTDDSSIGATQYAAVTQRVEGNNVYDLEFGTANAKSFTVSFWVRSSVTGTFGFAIQNAGGTRAYATTYSISTADTWEKKTITIPGDTTGTWETGNLFGLQLILGLGIGSTYTVSTNNSWETGLLFGAVGATNLFATNGATFYITGVQLEPGTVATPFERRSYGQELALCQRYYCTTQTSVRAFAPGAGAVYENQIYWPVQMRAAPTTSGPTGALILNISSHVLQGPSATGARSVITAAGAGDAYAVSRDVTASAEL